MDPLQFIAGTSSLRGYVKQSPTLSIDPTGLADLPQAFLDFIQGDPRQTNELSTEESQQELFDQLQDIFGTDAAGLSDMFANATQQPTPDDVSQMIADAVAQGNGTRVIVAGPSPPPVPSGTTVVGLTSSTATNGGNPQQSVSNFEADARKKGAQIKHITQQRGWSSLLSYLWWTKNQNPSAILLGGHSNQMAGAPGFRYKALTQQFANLIQSRTKPTTVFIFAACAQCNPQYIDELQSMSDALQRPILVCTGSIFNNGSTGQFPNGLPTYGAGVWVLITPNKKN